MSGISAASNFAALAVSMVRKAGAIGAAAAEVRAVSRAAPERPWRRADLLWPTFTKG